MISRVLVPFLEDVILPLISSPSHPLPTLFDEVSSSMGSMSFMQFVRSVTRPR